MPDTVTTNMGLTAPGVGTSQGPAYASLINADFDIIDSHNHSAGSGVQVSPSGLNINSDLPFGGNNATLMRTVRFQAQGSPITGSSTSDVGCIYSAGVDLYFNDGNGNQVRLTQSGGVAGSPGSITGLASPATATYVSLSEAFVWQSAANVAANLDCRSVILRNSGASSNGLTLSPPALTGNLSQALPLTPAATSFITMDSGGAMGTNVAIDQGITRAMQAAVGQQISDNSRAYNTTITSFAIVNSMSVTLTTTGRPVMLVVRSVGSSSSIGCQQLTPNLAFSTFSLFRGSVAISEAIINAVEGGAGLGATQVPAGALSTIDVPSAGTYTYTLRVRSNSSSTSTIASYCSLAAYEL